MITKIVFFAIAVVFALTAAALTAAAAMVVGHLTNMPLGYAITTAATLGVAVFGITVAIFSMAGSLFLTDSKPSPPSKPDES